MTEKPKLWIESMCDLLADVERESRDCLGIEKNGFFVNVANDCMNINAAVRKAYGEELNFLMHIAWGIFKEVTWFHFFFVSGNYPILLSRLRYVWESVFRAFFAENFFLPSDDCPWPLPGPTPDDKLAWLEKHERHLRWDSCMEPVLCVVLPLAGEEKEVRDHYKWRWDELNKYVHPSAYVASRLIDESALLVRDAFDEQWALETIDIARDVFDLVWLTMMRQHPRAFDDLAQLHEEYHVTSSILAKRHAPVRLENRQGE